MTTVRDQYKYQIKKVCKVLDKSPQAYYKYLKSDTSLRESELEFIVISYIMEARKSNPGIGGVSLWMQYCREWGTRYPVGRDKFVSYIRKHKLYVRIPRRYKAPRPRTPPTTCPPTPTSFGSLSPINPIRCGAATSPTSPWSEGTTALSSASYPWFWITIRRRLWAIV